MLENLQLRQEIRRLRGDLARSYGIGNIIAADPQMKAVLRKLEQFVDANATVIITGESGTGKDLLARALHFESRRRDAPFVPVNCAAIPDNLIESELFGYARGAFTDARQSKLGLFQAARGGTLFLDEIGEMPLRAAGQAAARHRGQEGAPARRDRGDSDRRAHRRRDQHQSR